MGVVRAEEMEYEEWLLIGLFLGWWRCSEIRWQWWLCDSEYSKNHWIAHLRSVNFMVCELQSNKAVIEKTGAAWLIPGKTESRVKKYLKKIFLTFIYPWDRGWTGEGQRERETQNLKQAPDSELSAQSPMWGLSSRSARSWPEPKSDA